MHSLARLTSHQAHISNCVISYSSGNSSGSPLITFRALELSTASEKADGRGESEYDEENPAQQTDDALGKVFADE